MDATELFERMARDGRRKLDAEAQVQRLELEIVRQRKQLRWSEGFSHFQKSVAADLGIHVTPYISWNAEQWQPETPEHAVTVNVPTYEDIRVCYVNTQHERHYQSVGGLWQRHYWLDDARKVFAVPVRRWHPDHGQVLLDAEHYWHYAPDLDKALAHAQDAGRLAAQAALSLKAFEEGRKLRLATEINLDINDLAA